MRAERERFIDVMRELLPGLLFAAALGLFAFRLAIPPRYVMDEVYHAFTAAQIVEGNPDVFNWNAKAPRAGVGYTWNHPPLGVLLIAGGVAIWGDGPFGWRFASALFGALGATLGYLLAWRLTGHRTAGVLTALFLMLDTLYFTQSRIGMLDIFGTVFMLAAFLFLHRTLVARPAPRRADLMMTGLCLGAAIAVKWNAAYATAVIAVVLLARVARTGLSRRDGSPGESGAVFRREAAWILLAVGVVPTVVYVAAYTPFFAAGSGPREFLALQEQIFRYHAGLQATHDYASRWWQWPLTLRPVWYYVQYDPDGTVAHVYANGNPLLHWLFVPAVCAVLWAWRRRPPLPLILAVGFFGQWLPWALVPRVAFVYHFLPAATFGCVALGIGIAALLGAGRWRRTLGIAYAVAVLAAFVFFYPTSSAVPLTRQAIEARMWLDSWR